jgi:1,4-dihydroxy-2-naphthoyl-CoA hydrolase
VNERRRPPASEQPPWAKRLGIRITVLTPDKVEGELLALGEFGNGYGILHGGAIMTFADNLAGTATTANLPEHQSTTTIESKTNFFAAIRVGETVRGECVPLHRGRTTMVWQSRITRQDGRLAAIVIHTQMVIPVRA